MEDKKVFEAVHRLATEINGKQIFDVVNPSFFYGNVMARVRELGLKSFWQYMEKVNSDPEEYDVLVSNLTIHTTSWFREEIHFDRFSLLAKQLLFDGKIHLKVLSLACSTGQEIYSFGLILSELKKEISNFTFELVGGDVDMLSLNFAEKGIYPASEIQSMAAKYRGFFKPVDTDFQHYIVHPSIRENTSFRKIDLKSEALDVSGFDFVVCRNVLYYFDHDQMRDTISRICKTSSPGSFVFFGHCEFTELNQFGFTSLGNNIFTRAEEVKSKPLTKIESTSTEMKKILVVDDDPEIRELICMNIDAELGFQTYEAEGVNAAKEMLKEGSYDVMILDYKLKDGLGIEVCHAAKSLAPQLPIVMFTGAPDKNLRETALAQGVSEFFIKPVEFDSVLRTISHLSQIKRSTKRLTQNQAKKPVNAILLGASTGGPEALREYLKNLKRPTPPIIIIQHIDGNHAEAFAKWISEETKFGLSLCSKETYLVPDRLHLASVGEHVKLELDKYGLLKLVVDFSENRFGSHKPSVDALFESAASIGNSHFVCALFTGMGRDGAVGMQKLFESGSTCFLQDEKSSVVYGMPGAAKRLGVLGKEGNPEEIAKLTNEEVVSYITTRKLAS